MLEVRDLSVEITLPSGSFRPVRNVDLTVQAGEKLCIVGESGCGKSLTSLAIMGLLPRNARLIANQIRLDGTDISKLPAPAMERLRGDRLAMIFQDPMTSLNPTYAIGTQLTEVMLRHQDVSRAEARDRAIYLLGRVGMAEPAERMRQFPHQLSGGLRQRVMIAMALMCGPSILVADEPTTALDLTVQAQTLRLLNDLCAEFRMGLILITHDLGVVARIADKVVVMYAGEVVEAGPVDRIFRRPAHPYTRGLLQCIPIPGKVRRGEPLGSIPGQVPDLGRLPAGCSFASRCSHKDVQCTTGVSFRDLSPEHKCRCVFALAS